MAVERAPRDAYVAGCQLLNTMGLVTYKKLGRKAGAPYNPLAHYDYTPPVLGDFVNSPSPTANGYSQPRP